MLKQSDYMSMDASHSVCLNVDWLIFLSNRIKFLRLQTSFCQFQTWLLPGLRKMLTSGIFQHKMVSQYWWVLQFCWTHVIFYCCGRCFSHYCMALWCCLADVIALLPYECNFCFLFGWCYSLVALLIRIDGDVYTIRLMLFALLVDG